LRQLVRVALLVLAGRKLLANHQDVVRRRLLLLLDRSKHTQGLRRARLLVPWLARKKLTYMLHEEERRLGIHRSQQEQQGLGGRAAHGQHSLQAATLLGKLLAFLGNRLSNLPSGAE
jgi:hypothetical protein